MIITVAELKTILTIKGITTSYSDTELQSIIDYKVKELSGLTELNITPTRKLENIMNNKSNRLLLNHYPVSQVVSLKVDNHELSSDEFILDGVDGIIYFTNYHYKGNIVIDYCTCLDDNTIETVINPLIVNMIIYDLTNKENNLDGSVSSISEGNTSISYDVSTTLGGKIQTTINDLKFKYGARIKVL